MADIDQLKDFFKQRNAKAQEEKNEVFSIIGNGIAQIEASSLSEEEKHEKQNRLSTIGPFLSQISSDIQVIDAIGNTHGMILALKKQKVFLQLMNLSETLPARLKQKAARAILIEVEEKVSDITGVYSIAFNDDTDLTQQHQEVVDELVNLLSSQVFSGQHIVEIQKNEAPTFYLQEKLTIQEEILTSQRVHTIVNKLDVSVSTLPIWTVLLIEGDDDWVDFTSIDDTILESSYSCTSDRLYLYQASQKEINQLKN